jgi:hypothetical protein
VNYTYAIERRAARTVFDLSARERRLLALAFEQLARQPMQPADFEEPAVNGRILFTKFCGPFSITYWLDHAVKEVRIVFVYRD